MDDGEASEVPVMHLAACGARKHSLPVRLHAHCHGTPGVDRRAVSPHTGSRWQRNPPGASCSPDRHPHVVATGPTLPLLSML